MRKIKDPKKNLKIIYSRSWRNSRLFAPEKLVEFSD